MNFTDSLKSDEGTYTATPKGPKRDLDRAIRRHIRNGGKVGGVEGIYGDYAGAGAYVEKVIRPEEGGIYTKFYGCSYLYKGEVIGEVVDQVATVKRVVMEGLYLLSKHPIRCFLGKKWRGDVIKSFLRIYEADLEKKQLPLKEFKRGIREIIRVCIKYFPERLVYCFAMFLENDNAYWFPIQDILSVLNQDWLYVFGVRDEVKRLCDTLIERQHSSLKQKFTLVKRLLMIGLWLSPTLRKKIYKILIELNLKEVKPDEADIYFTLNRRAMDYRGESFEERLKKWHLINEEKKHIILGL